MCEQRTWTVCCFLVGPKPVTLESIQAELCIEPGTCIASEPLQGESSEDCTSASNLESARVDLQPLHEPSENQPGVCVEHQPSQAKSPAETSHQELTTFVEQQALQESFQENDASGMELVPDLCIQPLCTQVALTEDCATVMGGPTKCVEPQQAELDGKDGAALSKGTAEPTRKASLEALASSGSGAEASPRAESEVDVKLDKAIPAVQICIRLRPMLQWEKSDGYTHSAMQLKEDDGTISLKEEGRNRQFRFNRVIGEERTQQEVWDMSGIEDVVGKVALGFHATVFAYGQTGTGKTHTMEGFNYEHFCGSAPSAAASRPRVKARFCNKLELKRAIEEAVLVVCFRYYVPECLHLHNLLVFVGAAFLVWHHFNSLGFRRPRPRQQISWALCREPC